jgi:hypothetical protein
MPQTTQPLADLARLRILRQSSTCSCGWRISACEYEGQTDGDCSRHDERVEILAAGQTCAYDDRDEPVNEAAWDAAMVDAVEADS